MGYSSIYSWALLTRSKALACAEHLLLSLYGPSVSSRMFLANDGVLMRQLPTPSSYIVAPSLSPFLFFLSLRLLTDTLEDASEHADTANDTSQQAQVPI